MYIICNNKLLEEDELVLTPRNRAFQYNDGFFETLILKNGKIRFWDDHLERMTNATSVLKLNIPEEFTEHEVNKQLTGLAKVNSISESARVKIRVWRSGGGLYTPNTSNAEYIITADPFTDQLQPEAVLNTGFYSGLKNHYSAVSFFKGPHALQYVLAGIEKKEKNLGEIIISDDQGNISEALSSNIFWIKEDVVYTPSLQTGCVAGIMRKNVLAVCASENIKTKESFFKMDELLSADVIFTCNVTGIRYLEHVIDNTFCVQHPIVSLLHQKLIG